MGLPTPCQRTLKNSHSPLHFGVCYEESAKMAGWWFMLFWVLAPSFANAGVIDLAKRTVLSDLSGGFCRSYRFGGRWGNDSG